MNVSVFDSYGCVLEIFFRFFCTKRMTTQGITSEQIRKAAKSLEVQAAEMRKVADFMDENELGTLKTHWKSMAVTYIPQIKRFVHGMHLKAKDQVESADEGVPSAVDRELDKNLKDARTKVGRAFQAQIREAVDQTIQERIESGELQITAAPKKSARKKRMP